MLQQESVHTHTQHSVRVRTHKQKNRICKQVQAKRQTQCSSRFDYRLATIEKIVHFPVLKTWEDEIR